MAYRATIRRAVSAALAAGTLTVGLMALAPATTAGASTPTSATWAELPATTPNFILPYYPGSLCSVANIDQFQWLMYRPLYWFGNGATPAVNPKLSLAGSPQYSGDTVTVTLKNYKWSNGEPVTGQDVVFFMNIYKAEPTGFCGYVPGYMPDNVTDVTAKGQTVTFTLTKSYNKVWFLSNELSQITPMPEAWDVSSTGGAPGSGGCFNAAYGTSAARTACSAVYTYLSDQAGYNPNNPQAANNSLSTYATNPLWQVVDGPWKLSQFNASGNVTFVPNPSYSGPVKPTLKKFIEVPYTTDDAEFNALAAGGQLSVGYLPTQDVTSPAPSTSKAGPNNPRLSSTYNMYPLYGWGITYFPENFNSTGNGGTAGKIFSQFYFRQAFQRLIDQPLFIKKIFKNYAAPTYGPVPVLPKNNLATKTEETNPYPYSPSKAKSLLSSNGWKVVPNGTDVCEKAGTAKGDCGAGIPKGTKLDLSIQAASGTTWLTQIMTAEKSAWASAGINVNITYATFDTVTGNAVPCPKGCSWQMQQWGGGWIFSPDTYPTGEALFGAGSIANYGNYNKQVPGFALNAKLIKQTINTNAKLATWENYLATQLPVVFEPNPALSLTEVQKGLSGVTPQNVYWALLPENWRWTS